MGKLDLLKPDPRAIIQNIYAQIIIGVVGAIPFGAIIAKFFGIDPLGFGALMNQPIAWIIYCGITVAVGIILFAVIRIVARRVKPKEYTIAWKMTPRDFGLNASEVRSIGFAIDSPRGKFNAKLQNFWLSELRQNPNSYLYFHLQVTSRNLRKTADGQFYLAQNWEYAPPFTLMLEDGVYGLFNLDGRYKARISITESTGNISDCFDITLRFDDLRNLKIESIEQLECDELLDGRTPTNDDYDAQSQDWSTVANFQPNQMYRKG